LEEEKRAPDGDLVARSKQPLLDWDAIYECSGRRFQVREQEAFVLPRDLAVKGRDTRVVDANRVGGVSTYT
jgi:hypothetical protein